MSQKEILKSKKKCIQSEAAKPNETEPLEVNSQMKRRARAKKDFACKLKPFSRLLGNVDVLKLETSCSEFMILNKLVLRDLQRMIIKKPSADLSSLLLQYTGHIKHILNHNGRYLESDNVIVEPLELKSNKINNKSLDQKIKSPLEIKAYSQDSSYSNFQKSKRITSQYSEAYVAICSLYGYDPFKDPEDSLTALLEQNFNSEEEVPNQFKYVKVDDVIKTKGVSIYGPRREDVGKYNRKLFEMQTRDFSKRNKLIINMNPMFFKETRDLAQKYEVTRCEQVELEYYSHGFAVKLDRYMMVVFLDQSEIFCTIKNLNLVLFDKMSHSQIKSSYKPNSKEIIMLYLETLVMYRILFHSEEAAKIMYEKFFSKNI